MNKNVILLTHFIANLQKKTDFRFSRRRIGRLLSSKIMRRVVSLMIEAAGTFKTSMNIYETRYNAQHPKRQTSSSKSIQWFRRLNWTNDTRPPKCMLISCISCKELTQIVWVFLFHSLHEIWKRSFIQPFTCLLYWINHQRWITICQLKSLVEISSGC